MKRFLPLLISLLLCNFSMIYGQELEVRSIPFSQFASPYNGEFITEVDNPNPTTGTSEKVARFTRSSGLYASINSDLTGGIYIDHNSTFSLNVLVSSIPEGVTEVPVMLILRKDNTTFTQLGNKQLITTENEWQTLHFDFSTVPTREVYYNQVFLFFGSPDTDQQYENISFFIDQLSTPLITETEVLESFTGNLDHLSILTGQLESQVANPSIDNINSNTTVGKVIKTEGVHTSLQFDLEGYYLPEDQPVFKLKMYMEDPQREVTSNTLKLFLRKDGYGSTQLVKTSDITVFDQWVEYTFDFKDMVFKEAYYNQVFLFFNSADTDLDATGNTFYLSDLTVPLQSYPNQIRVSDITTNTEGTAIQFQLNTPDLLALEGVENNFKVSINGNDFNIASVVQDGINMTLKLDGVTHIAQEDQATLSYTGVGIFSASGQYIRAFEQTPIQNKVSVEKEFPARFPSFSWNQIPVHLHFHKQSGLLTPEEADFVINHSNFITLEKTHAITPYGNTEAGIKAEVEQLKALDPDYKVIYYWNGFVHYNVYQASEEFLSHPEWVLDTRENGEGVEVVRYDISLPEVRDWWITSLKNTLDETGADGVFIDALIQVTLESNINLWGQEKYDAIVEGLDIMLKETREVIGGDKFIIINGYRSEYNEGVIKGLHLAQYADALLVEHFAFLGSESKENILMDIQTMDNLGKMGKSVIMKGWPGWYWRDIDFLNQYTNEELISISNDNIDFPLGCFLMGMHEYSYFIYAWGYASVDGGLGSYDKLFQNFGKPLGNFKKEGWVLSREFEHGKVTVDLESKSANIDHYLTPYWSNGHLHHNIKAMESENLGVKKETQTSPSTAEFTATRAHFFQKENENVSYIKLPIDGQIRAEDLKTFQLSMMAGKIKEVAGANTLLTLTLKKDGNSATQLSQSTSILTYDSWQNYTFDFEYLTKLEDYYNEVYLHFDGADFNSRSEEYYVGSLMGSAIEKDDFILCARTNQYGNQVVVSLENNHDFDTVQINSLTLKLEEETVSLTPEYNAFKKEIYFDLPKIMINHEMDSIFITSMEGRITDTFGNALENVLEINIENLTSIDLNDYYFAEGTNALIDSMYPFMGETELVNNPNLECIVEEEKVLKFTRSDSTVHSTMVFHLKNDIDFSISKVFTLKIFQPQLEQPITENRISCYLRKDNNVETQIAVHQNIEVQEEWIEVVFDFSDVGFLESDYNQVNLFYASPDTDFDASSLSIYFTALKGPSVIGENNRVSTDNEIINAIDLDSYESFSLYPIPATSIVHFSEPLQWVNITDVLGKNSVLKSGLSTHIDVQQLPKGVYVLQGKKVNAEVVTQKFVKE
ncbi:putative glycoside hydrolase [Flammeovirga aprica]|uniref:T9SS type A sorting domain-containing protein n=1 Tax=Flammeovirga aprica JL-4 TaxID=694437 RepID=A0A7X9P3V9_9BACT|nr:putative glycoside hydrolase [Flammeovirga aprica]NME68722.1 T9SS type A sorting domain-containing protein [Flammeovirga aprica JL-4]